MASPSARYDFPILEPEPAMPRQGVTVFLLFFGIATLDALNEGRWLRIAFWLAMGAGFAILDWWGVRKAR
jgi:hypothetical protein